MVTLLFASLVVSAPGPRMLQRFENLDLSERVKSLQASSDLRRSEKRGPLQICLAAGFAQDTSAPSALPSSGPNLQPSSKSRTPAPPSDDESWFDRYVWSPVGGLVLGVVMAVSGALIYDRLKRRVRIVAMSHYKSKLVDQIHSLYLDRIEPTDRVSPLYVTDCLRSQSICVTSPRSFVSECRKTQPPLLHVLLAALCQGEVVGFLKAVYLRRVQTLFVAYVAVRAEQASVEARAMRGLLDQLHRLAVATGVVKWVAFEVTTAHPQRAAARVRLFRQHGQRYGLDPKRLDISYLQPDLDCRNLRQCQEEPAQLYLAGVDNTPRRISLDVAAELIEALYLDLYLSTWAIDHDRSQVPALRQYVIGLSRHVLWDVSDPIALS